jgi:hypothetical protein
VESELGSCQAALEEEARLDAEARAKWGDKWNTPVSSTLAKHFWDKVSSYRSTLAQAADSDQKVIQKLMDNDAAFAALLPENAAAQMPRLQAPLVNVSSDDPAVVVASLRRWGACSWHVLHAVAAGLEPIMHASAASVAAAHCQLSGAALQHVLHRHCKPAQGLTQPLPPPSSPGTWSS